MEDERICPMRSTAELDVPCTEKCAWYADNDECAVKNVCNFDASEFQESLKEQFIEICRSIDNLRQN